MWHRNWLYHCYTPWRCPHTQESPAEKSWVISPFFHWLHNRKGYIVNSECSLGVIPKNICFLVLFPTTLLSFMYSSPAHTHLSSNKHPPTGLVRKENPIVSLPPKLERNSKLMRMKELWAYQYSVSPCITHVISGYIFWNLWAFPQAEGGRWMGLRRREIITWLKSFLQPNISPSW